MSINGIHLSEHLRHAWRSLTVQFSILLMVLPDLLNAVQSNFPTIAPFIPEALHSRVINLIALAIFVLRLRTTTSLAGKAPVSGQESGT